jgi:hypothetical protein
MGGFNGPGARDGMVGKHFNGHPPYEDTQGVHDPGHLAGREDRGYVGSISLGDI